MSKKKVVLLHNILSPHVTPIFQLLSKKVNLVVLYCAENEENRKWSQKPKGFAYKILPNYSIKIKGKDLFTYFINPTIFAELDIQKPDIIIISGWDIFAYQAAFLYAKIKGIKFILWSGTTAIEQSWRRSLSKLLVMTIVKGSDAYIAYGTRAKDYLISLGANPKKIFISFNTTNLDLYKRKIESLKKIKKKNKQQLGIEKQVLILYYGQLIERKGVEILLESFILVERKFKKCSLFIIGDGPLKTKLEETIKNNDLDNVFLIPNPGDNQMFKYFAIADIFVLPSKEEVWGLVLNQALVAGLPVITTKNVGSAVDLVRGNGLIVEAANSNQMARAMLRLLKDKKLRNSFAKKSQILINNFYPTQTVKGCEDAIDSINDSF